MARSPGSGKSDRAFKNPFDNYHDHGLYSYISRESLKLQPKYEEPIIKGIEKIRTLLSLKIDEDIGRGDHSVYTGTAGHALLCLTLFLKMPQKDATLLHDALTYLKPCLKSLKHKRISFLCGDSGPLALAAVIYHYLGDRKHSVKYVGRLEILCEEIDRSDIPDEILYGRSGYLSALLFVQNHLGQGAINPQTIITVVHEIIKSGERLAKKQRCSFPLMYEWHEKAYLGAAHGLAGIYYMLLQVQELAVQDKVRELVKPCLDFLLTQRYASGNGKSSLGSGSEDRLVHWCHGAPGWVQLFCLAHSVYGDRKYLDAGRDCGRVVWERGLLRKGYGLCHGAAGNGYTFISLYKHTNDARYLHYALKFAEWCCDFGTHHGCRTPDRPWSLFEGLSGTAQFLVDILEPGKACFPGYDLMESPM